MVHTATDNSEHIHEVRSKRIISYVFKRPKIFNIQFKNSRSEL